MKQEPKGTPRSGADRNRLRSRRRGCQDNRYANVYEISGDRVRAVREYMDTQHTAQSFAAVTSGRGD